MSECGNVMQHNRQQIQNECSRISISEKALTRYYLCNQNLEKHMQISIQLPSCKAIYTKFVGSFTIQSSATCTE